MTSRTATAAAYALAIAAFTLGPAADSTRGQCQLAEPFPPGVEGTDAYASAVSLSGDYALIGARLDDDFGSNSGAVYVFVREADTWVEQAKLTASDADAADLFGAAVAISGDTAVVGAHGNTDHGSADGTGSGSAYILCRTGTTWTEEAKLLASDAEAGDEFGYSVAIDGHTVAIGAKREDSVDHDAGAAYIFHRTGTTWTEQAKIVASDGQEYSNFGYAIDVDADTVVVGARYDDGAGIQAGAAYIFERSGTAWTQQAVLHGAPDPAYTWFGTAVTVSGDTVAVGAPGDYEGAGHNTGAVFLFQNTGSTWERGAKLMASDAEIHDEFGNAVSLDGDHLVVGAWLEDDAGSSSGAAYIFTRSADAWTEQAKLIASDATYEQYFGFAVSASGADALMGAFGNYWVQGSDPGAAYVVSIDGPDCNQNRICDFRDIADGTSSDINGNGTPDECEDVCAGQTLGDCNGDASLNALDIDPFVDALLNPNQFNVDYAPLLWQCVADCNADGSLNGLDIDPFVALLTGA